MVGRKRGDIPKSLVRGQLRFEAWRRSREVGARIPDKLWSLAVTLAEVHGLSRTASALKLDYHGLKNRVAGRNCDSSSVAPAFIELTPSPQAPSTECVVELEDGLGGEDARASAGLRGPGSGRSLPELSEARLMLQITPQMKILVAVESADFRKGIDGLVRLCKDTLGQDPFAGTVFVFRNRRGTAIKVLVYDGQGFWLCHKRLSEGRFRWWPSALDQDSKAKTLAAHQLAVLFSAGNPDRTAAAPDWRPVGPLL